MGNNMSQQLELLSESPSQWNTVIYVAPEIQRKEIKPFFVLALKELEGVGDSRTASLLCADKFASVLGVVRHVARLRSARSRAQREWSHHDLVCFLEGLRFSGECAHELASLLCAEEAFSRAPAHLRARPALLALSWKIDLSLSRQPRVLVLLRLSDGEARGYLLAPARFLELRYRVAAALKSLLVLQRRKCMRDA